MSTKKADSQYSHPQNVGRDHRVCRKVQLYGPKWADFSPAAAKVNALFRR
ncbi:MAG: hypothetical protein IJX14_07395 [Clostridia bacterium]|nr:hypothetical protein [Clostridia bacterium]